MALAFFAGRQLAGSRERQEVLVVGRATPDIAVAFVIDVAMDAALAKVADGCRLGCALAGLAMEGTS